jgi:hypothetical protein
MAREKDSDGNEDLDTMRVPELRAMIRKMRAQRLSDRNPEEVRKDEEKAEAERKKLSDLHEEKKGAAPKIPVEDDDLPEVLAGDDEEEGSEYESCDCSEEECDDPKCATHGKGSKASKGR